MSDYRLVVRRDTGTSYSPPEHPDLPAVSEAAFALLASRDLRDEGPTATWHGGPCSDTNLPIGRAVISGRVESHAAVDELLPLLRWCRTNTRNTDVCELEET